MMMTRTADHDPHLDAAVVSIAPIAELRGDEAAGAALRAIHRVLLDAIRANVDGVRRRGEGDYLHDFRVAVRRTRTGLRQLERVYPADVRAEYSAGFAWLSKSTGPARDLEVFRESLDDFGAALGDAATAALDPLAAFLRGREDEERRRCTEALSSARYGVLIDGWARFLDRPGDFTSAAAGEDAARPCREVAAEAIERAYVRVVRRGAGIDPAAPVADFHRLRLDGKKLRYLLEFFCPLFDPQRTGRTIGSLRRIQDALGKINDLRVQAEWIGRAPAATAAAASPLVAHIEAAQRLERERFVAGFAAFTGAAQAETMRHLLDRVVAGSDA